MDKLARKVDIHHAAMQGSYFAGFSAIWGFGPVLLLYLGLSNSTLGVVTSLALVLPLLLQPALAALSDADSRWTSRRLALVLSLLTLAAAVVMTVSTGSKTVLVAAYAVIGVLLVSTSPFFNSMVMEYHLRGVNVNYGLGRGTGSTTYAIVALVMGFVLERRSPTVILPVLLAAVVFGPGAGFAVGAVADIIGGVLAGYAINPLITLGAGAIGLVAGFAWQKLNRLSTNLRLAASVLLGHFVGSMVITLLALRLFYGYPWATLAVRIPNALILSAVNVVLLRILLENRSLMKLAKK